MFISAGAHRFAGIAGRERRGREEKNDPAETLQLDLRGRTAQTGGFAAPLPRRHGGAGFQLRSHGRQRGRFRRKVLLHPQGGRQTGAGRTGGTGCHPAHLDPDADRRHAGILLRRRADAPPAPAFLGPLLRKGLSLRETRVRQRDRRLLLLCADPLRQVVQDRLLRQEDHVPPVPVPQSSGLRREDVDRGVHARGARHARLGVPRVVGDFARLHRLRRRAVGRCAPRGETLHAAARRRNRVFRTAEGRPYRRLRDRRRGLVRGFRPRRAAVRPLGRRHPPGNSCAAGRLLRLRLREKGHAQHADRLPRRCQLLLSARAVRCAFRTETPLRGPRRAPARTRSR